VPSQDDYYGNVDAYGNPRNYRGNHNANFAVSKGKGKGKFPNPKGRRNAAPKEWDPDYVVIPEFGIAQGEPLYPQPSGDTRFVYLYGKNSQEH
jgi:hypothetical protein